MAKGLTPTKAIKDIMKTKEVTNAAMSDLIGKTPQTTYERLAKDDIKMSSVCEMLRVLGYCVKFVPRDESVTAGQYKIDV